MADEKKNVTKSNNVIIESRQNAMFSGVLDVSGFNENCINMYTEGGALVLKGSGLHIVRLSIETGEVSVEGSIDSLVYSNRERRQSEGVLTRLFK
ncbi:MAG: sporulation protein YabP [Clostridiales bacterium]|nr:MAG: sporulation protein YabP [Clostridiales bacterium]